MMTIIFAAMLLPARGMMPRPDKLTTLPMPDFDDKPKPIPDEPALKTETTEPELTMMPIPWDLMGIDKPKSERKLTDKPKGEPQPVEKKLRWRDQPEGGIVEKVTIIPPKEDGSRASDPAILTGRVINFIHNAPRKGPSLFVDEKFPNRHGSWHGVIYKSLSSHRPLEEIATSYLEPEETMLLCGECDNAFRTLDIHPQIDDDFIDSQFIDQAMTMLRKVKLPDPSGVNPKCSIFEVYPWEGWKRVLELKQSNKMLLMPAMRHVFPQMMRQITVKKAIFLIKLIKGGISWEKLAEFNK